MKTAVIYARYSSDSQTEQSIEGQLRVCNEYAKNNNIVVLNTYIDRAMTGTNDNRPDFQRMIKDSCKKTFDYVLVYKLDRFSRDKYETAIHKKTLKDNGVKVISAMENIPNTPEGIILESLLEGMNQYYSAELSQKVKRGMRENRRKGLYQGGGIPYGYKVENSRLVEDEFTANVVRYIFEQYANGVYVKDIITNLTARGILHYNKPFAKNTMYEILKNEKYSGTYRHENEIVDKMYPRIIDKELFDRVRAKVNANKYGKTSVKTDFLLRGKLICGYCGQSINGESGTKNNGERMFYYKCNGRKKRINDCNKSIIRKETLEELVIDKTIEELSKPNVISFIVSKLLKIQEENLKESTTMSLLIKQQKHIETSINNIVNAIERGIVSNATNKRLKALEEQQLDIERQILIERSKKSIMLTENNIKEYYTQMLDEPKLLINYLIKKIVVYDDKIEIYYNSPINTNPDDESCRDFSFYSNSIEIVSKYNRYEACIQQILLVMYV